MGWMMTTGARKIMGMEGRLKAVFGGASASKTYSIIPHLINTAIENPNEVITVVSDTARNLRDGAQRDFIAIMKAFNRWDRALWKATTNRYEFRNGSVIEFLGADDPDKFRGPRRDRLYVNEANRLDFETFNQLDARTRKEVLLDWNPTSPFWYDNEIKGVIEHEWVRLTYLDNESLSEQEIAFFEKRKEMAQTSEYWNNWWRVYGLGLNGQVEGACVKDYMTCTKGEDGLFYHKDKQLQGYKLVGIGLDFGVNDPNAAIALYKRENSYIFDQILYKPKIYLSDIKSSIKKYLVGMDNVPIYADYSWKQNLLELNKMGLTRVTACKKATIEYRIRMLNEQEIYVTDTSVDLLREFESYRYKIDKNGEKVDGKYEGDDHAVDAAGYVLIKHLQKRLIKVY